MTWSVGRLFYIKPIPQRSTPLKRTLGSIDVLFLGTGVVVGVAIFILPGIAAKYAGPATMISTVIAGLACACIALPYAELASMVPITGGVYTYAYTIMGQVVAWLVGWNMLLASSVASSEMAFGWSSYIQTLLSSAGIHLPRAIGAGPFDGGIINLPAVIIVLFIGTLLVIGTRQSAKVTVTIVILKLSLIAVFVALAVPHIRLANWIPFLPFGIAGVFKSAAIWFSAFLGFDSITSTAEECKDPGRALPIGILGALAIAGVVYIAVAAAMTGAVSYVHLNTAAPLPLVLRILHLPVGVVMIAVGAVAGLTSSILVVVFGLTRMVFAISRDSLLPRALSAVSSKTHTPQLATGVVIALVAAVAGTIPIDPLVRLVTVTAFVPFAIVTIGVIILRYTQPERERPFRCPAILFIAPVGTGISFYMALTLGFVAWIPFLIWLALGALIYLFYGYRNANNPDVLRTAPS